MSAWVASAVLLSALVHAGWNALVKGGGGTPRVNLVALSAGWTLLSPLMLWWVPWPAAAAWPWLLSSVAVHVLYMGLLSAAYSHGDFGAVYPLVRGIPPLLVAGTAAVFLAEPLPPLAWAGVLSVSAGLFMLTSRARRGAALRGTLYALATALTVATYTVVDGIGVRASEGAVGYLVWMSALQGVLFVMWALSLWGRELWVPLRRQLPRGVATGLLAGCGYGVALWGMTQAPIALVSALRETSVLFGAVFATFILRESFGPRRLAAAALVALGAVCIQLGG